MSRRIRATARVAPTTRAAGVCHDAIADGVIPPGTGPAPSVPRPLALILGDSRFGIGQARRGWLEKQDVLNTRPLDALLPLIRRTM